MAYVLTINGVAKDIQPDWSITRLANGVGRMSFKVYSADGSYVPDLDQEVLFTDSGTRIFGGNINGVRERGAIPAGVTPIMSEVTALDFNDLTTRLYFGLGISAGTLKHALQSIIAYIPGATLHASQVNGPSLPDITYSAWVIKDILDQFSEMTGYTWEVDYDKFLRMQLPGSLAAPFNITAGTITDGDVKTEWSRINYYNSVVVWGTGFNGSYNDVVQQGLHGIWQTLIIAPDSKTQASVDALGTAVLAASTPIVKKIEYETYTSGFVPGQTQSINIPARHINNTFLIYEVTKRPIGNIVKSTVKAIEGTQYQPGWRETIKTWGGTSGIGVSGTGGISGVPFLRFAYFLGGSGLDFVQSPTSGVWVSASPIQVQINTVTRGGTDAIVKGRLRALNAGISVQARLYDVTAAAACPGLSAVITSTSWSAISFGTTLTAGNHLYELQLLPSVGLEEVGAVCYVE